MATKNSRNARRMLSLPLLTVVSPRYMRPPLSYITADGRANGPGHPRRLECDLAQRAGGRVLETDKVQSGNAGLLAEPARPATCVGDGPEVLDHFVQTRGIAGGKNDGLERMLGAARKTHPIGKNFLHRRQHADFALLDHGDGADVEYGNTPGFFDHTVGALRRPHNA